MSVITAQIPDTFIYKGESYDLIGLDGEGLITSEHFGMKPKMLHTACYRGFYSTYVIDKGVLTIEEMTLAEKDNNYVSINGVEPVLKDNLAEYNNINLLVNFTGRIRLAKDFIEDLYEHMGYQKPTSYEKVLDFVIKNGYVEEVHDRSAEVEEKRREIDKRYKAGGQIEEIEEAFNLDMDIN